MSPISPHAFRGLCLLFAMCALSSHFPTMALATGQTSPSWTQTSFGGAAPVIEVLHAQEVLATAPAGAPSPCDEAKTGKAEPEFDQERRAVFDFGAPDADGIFAGSRLILLSDRFGFLPSPAFLNAPVAVGPSGGAVAAPQLRTRTFTLIGRLSPVGPPGTQLLELHGAHEGPTGSLFTLDGFIRAEGGEWVLDAVYSIGLRGSEQIGHVRMRLQPRPESPTAAVGSPIPDSVQSPDRPWTAEELERKLAAYRAEQERMLWEGGNDAFFRFLVESYHFSDETPDIDPVLFTRDEPDYIEGIPVPSWFDVKLDGTVDDIPFGPLPAMLMFSKSEQPGQAISVLLSADGFPDGPPGTIGVSTSMGTAWDVDATNGELRFRLLNPPAGLGYSLTWSTLLNEAVTMAVPERVDASLSVVGTSIQGALKAEGHVALDGTRTSRYSATITGALRRNQVIEQVLASVGIFPLTGDWQTNTDSMGIIRLKREGEARKGSFGPEMAGTLDGQIADGILTLSWADGAGQSGWGFLRPLSVAGRALGMWGTEPNRADAVPVLATQPREPWSDRDAADVTDEQLDQLHKLGRDLASQGKCTQALSVLDLVWNAYGQRLQSQAERPEVEIFGVLVEKNTIIQPMIDCAFDLGLYGKTLDYLREALALQREMNPLTRARNAFTSQVARTTGDLLDMAGTVSLLIDNLEPLRSPKVGMMFDPKASGQPLIIGAIASGSPAARAGLKPGDEIIAIDGEAARPLDTEGALRTLQGSEGTSLRLTVSTAGESREIVVVRGPWHYGIRSSERRVQLEQAMESLRLSAEETSSSLLTLADAVGRAKPPAQANETAFDEAFQGVMDLIEEEKASVPQRVQRLIALGESLFSGWHRYMPTQRFVLHTADKMTGDTGQVPAAKRPETVDPQKPVGVIEDEMIAELFADPSINGAEASLFFEHFKAVVLTLGLSAQLKTAIHIIENWKRRAKPSSDDIQEHARRIARFSRELEQWRGRLALDKTRIAALNAGTAFSREWLKVLWDLEPKTESVSKGGAMGGLIAAESVRNRATQDLLAAREDLALARRNDARTALASFETQAPLTVDELVDLVRARGGTTVAYYALDDRLLVWVLDAAQLSCTCERAPVIQKVATQDDPYYDVLQELRTVAEGQSQWDKQEIKSCQCRGIEARELDVSACDLKTYADDFQSFVTRDGISIGDGSAQAFANLLHDLYQRLVAPIAHLLPTDPEAVVTIIPDAELFQIPFGALITTPVNDLGGLRYLIEDHPLAYLTSIGMMRFTQQNARRAAEMNQRDFVTFWDPVGIEYSGLKPFSKSAEMRTTLEDVLTASYPESAPRQVFSGAEATRENVLATASQAGVLTFVTHAKASDIPGDDRGSYIAMAGAPLTLRDVYGLDLHAKLAILAGCETGRGRIGADGVIGLSRAFTFAGAPTLAMSLWEIPETDTVLFLDRFYRAYLG